MAQATTQFLVLPTTPSLKTDQIPALLYICLAEPAVAPLRSQAVVAYYYRLECYVHRNYLPAQRTFVTNSIQLLMVVNVA